jgi:zinc transport system substrate-binding protein
MVRQTVSGKGNDLLKKIAPFILVLIAAFIILPQCSPKEQAKDSLDVFVSILPLSYLVERIGGEYVNVHVLVDPGKSPATFEPTPRQMVALAQADLYFAVGQLPFEKKLLAKIRESSSSFEIVIAAKDIKHRPMTSNREHPDHDGHAHGLVDPHVWLSPPLLKIMAEVICESLEEKDSEHRPLYRANLNRLNANIDDIHERVATALEPYRGRTIFVFHPAFGYFTDTYGLRQAAIEIEGKSPSPRQIEEIIRLARVENVRIIFVQPQFDKRSAESVAEAIGGVVVHMDPLAKDIPANFENFAEKILKAFEQR